MEVLRRAWRHGPAALRLSVGVGIGECRRSGWGNWTLLMTMKRYQQFGLRIGRDSAEGGGVGIGEFMRSVRAFAEGSMMEPGNLDAAAADSADVL
jgi:hypothetical protein